MDYEQKIIDLECRFTQHDDVLDTLNQQIYQQQRKIDELERLCVALAQKINDMQSQGRDAGGMRDEKPPHY